LVDRSERFRMCLGNLCRDFRCESLGFAERHFPPAPECLESSTKPIQRSGLED
jgi:hypothetical protein